MLEFLAESHGNKSIMTNRNETSENQFIFNSSNNSHMKHCYENQRKKWKLHAAVSEHIEVHHDYLHKNCNFVHSDKPAV